MSNRKFEEEEPLQDDEEAEQPKKKKKTNLRFSQNPEDRKYVTSSADFMMCALEASQGVKKRNEASRRREEERLKKQKEREEIKKEKRLDRFERSLNKKNKIKEAAASATIEDKKEKVRKLYDQRKEEMGGKKKQKQKRNRNQEE